jgi:hypothetical protein
MQASGRSIVVTAAVLLAGCTSSLQVNPLQGEGATRGFAYTLPFAQYEITVTRRLHSCSPNAVIRNHVTAVSQLRPDPAHGYAIDHSSLSSVMKVSAIGVRNHPNGTLRQITAEADDRTGPVITNTVSAGIDLAVAAVRAGALGGGVTTLTATCTPAVVAALRNVERTNAAMQTAKRNLDDATQRWRSISEATSILGARPDGATQAAVRQTVAALSSAVRAEATAKAAHVGALETVSHTSTVVWPRSGIVFSGGPQNGGAVDLLPDEVVTAWLRPGHTGLVEILGVRFEIRDAATGQAPSTTRSAQAGTPEDGIRYRMPARGRLVAVFEAGGEQEFAEEQVPQLGRLMLLPFSNGPFQNNILEASFNENGTLESARYGELASRAEAISATAAQVAAQVGPAIDAYGAARNAGLARQAARSQAQAAVLSADLELRNARSALTVDPNSLEERTRRLLGADTTLREAERANVEARIALEQARARARSAGVELP